MNLIFLYSNISNLFIVCSLLLYECLKQYLSGSALARLTYYLCFSFKICLEWVLFSRRTRHKSTNTKVNRNHITTRHFSLFLSNFSFKYYSQNYLNYLLSGEGARLRAKARRGNTKILGSFPRFMACVTRTNTQLGTRLVNRDVK